MFLAVAHAFLNTERFLLLPTVD